MLTTFARTRCTTWGAPGRRRPIDYVCAPFVPEYVMRELGAKTGEAYPASSGVRATSLHRDVATPVCVPCCLHHHNHNTNHNNNAHNNDNDNNMNTNTNTNTNHANNNDINNNKLMPERDLPTITSKPPKAVGGEPSRALAPIQAARHPSAPPAHQAKQFHGMMHLCCLARRRVC